MPGWAIDLGNSNTRVARWDDAADDARLLELRDICRQPGGEEPLEAPRLVPSATHVLEPSGWLDHVGRWPFVARRWFLGRGALIGRKALEANTATVHANFAPAFKPYLEREALRVIARVEGEPWSARDVARAFVRELLAEVQRATGTRIRDAVFTTPVESFESYRAEIHRVATALGVRRVRFVDEPVAAALGYGLGLTKDRRVLVIDFGGGTFHAALVALTPRGVHEGACTVLAKAGLALGGNLVNRWLLADVCRQLEFVVEESDPEDDEAALWSRLMLGEACRVKEALFFRSTATFHLSPPTYLRRAPVARPEERRALEVTRDELVELLRGQGFYDDIGRCVDEVLEEGARKGVAEAEVDDVLLVGGSTLLPEVFPTFERRFGRNRVRAWQPFEAVVRGACAHAAGRVTSADFIVHDYAFVTYDATTQARQHAIVVPRGTRFPTPPDLWKRRLVPTCPLGEPETMFKLVICEIGRPRREQRSLHWDAEGMLHGLGGLSAKPDEQVVVPLNESNPTLGSLDPPHSPGDKRPRLEVAFGVNVDRWLVATVRDLKTGKVLMDESPVVRLL